MNQYLTAEQYRAAGGKIPQATDETLNEWLVRASSKIDTLTFGRIDVDRLTAFQKDLLEAACRYQADYLYEADETGMAGISSWSVPDISISYGDKEGSDKWYEEQRISMDALECLNRSGLTWRGV